MPAAPRALACAASLLLAACGGSSGQGSTPADTTPTPTDPLGTSGELSGVASDVAVVGSTAFVKLVRPVTGAPPITAVQAVDLTDPLHPVVGDALADPGVVLGLAEWSGQLLVARCDPGDLSCARARLDAYDPVTLHTTGTVTLAPFFPVGLTTAGDRALVAGPGIPSGAMAVVDLASSQVVARYGTEETAVIAVRGNRAYLSGPSLALDVVDLTTVTAPRRIGTLAAAGSAGRPLSLAIVQTPAGLRAWIGYASAIAEVDLSDEAHPALLRTTRRAVWSLAIAVSGTRALVPDGSGVEVLDASDPAAAPTTRLHGPVEALDAAWLGARALTVGLLHGRTDASAVSVFDVPAR